MNLADPLTFNRSSASPEPEPGFVGVELVIGNELSATGNNKLWLHGTYQIPHTEALRISSGPLHKALVITWMSDDTNDTKNLVGDVVVFEDDEIIENDNHKGYFNYDLTDWLNLYNPYHSYYITVSLGKFISNTLEVSVNPIPE